MFILNQIYGLKKTHCISKVGIKRQANELIGT